MLPKRSHFNLYTIVLLDNNSGRLCPPSSLPQEATQTPTTTPFTLLCPCCCCVCAGCCNSTRVYVRKREKTLAKNGDDQKKVEMRDCLVVWLAGCRRCIRAKIALCFYTSIPTLIPDAPQREGHT
jgi:hypothetical protein